MRHEKAYALRQRPECGRGEFLRPAAIIAEGVEAHEPRGFARINAAFIAKDDKLLVGLKTGKLGTKAARCVGLKGMEGQFEVGGLARQPFAAAAAQAAFAIVKDIQAFHRIPSREWGGDLNSATTLNFYSCGTGGRV